MLCCVVVCLSMDNQNYFQTSKGYMTLIMEKVKSIPVHCGVAYESVHLLARSHVIRVCGMPSQRQQWWLHHWTHSGRGWWLMKRTKAKMHCEPTLHPLLHVFLIYQLTEVDQIYTKMKLISSLKLLKSGSIWLPHKAVQYLLKRAVLTYQLTYLKLQNIILKCCLKSMWMHWFYKCRIHGV